MNKKISLLNTENKRPDKQIKGIKRYTFKQVSHGNGKYKWYCNNVVW